MKYIINNECQLLDFLICNVKNVSKNKIKSMLKYEQVLVNNKIIKQYNYELKKNDIVTLSSTKKMKTDLEIIYEDKNIIVLDKPCGLLTIGTKDEKEKTLYHFVSEYVKLDNKNNNIFIIHRLDRDTSGIIMFAKNEKIKMRYQNNWNELVIRRSYVAIVDGIMKEKCGTIKTFLNENKEGYVYSSKSGKLAITEYKTIKENNNYSMINVNIKTGRKNQIRVHFKEIGHPILGDKKYGNKINPIKRLCLHANVLEITNPISKKIDKYESKIPKEFNKIFEVK